MIVLMRTTAVHDVWATSPARKRWRWPWVPSLWAGSSSALPWVIAHSPAGPASWLDGVEVRHVLGGSAG
jgi:hypothetical protein